MALAVVPINAPRTHRNAPIKPTTHPVDSFLGRLSPVSRRGFRIALNNIARIASNGLSDAQHLDWASLRYQDTSGIRKTLAERYSIRTANYGISALRGVMKEAWRLNQISYADYARAVDLIHVRGEETVAGRILKFEEMEALFRVCQSDATPAGVRDAAIVAVLYGTGLRRAELVSLNITDYSPDDGTLRVHGKGNKIRLAYLVGDSQRRFERWVEIRRSKPAFIVSLLLQKMAG